jgi:hypothetical protein
VFYRLLLTFIICLLTSFAVVAIEEFDRTGFCQNNLFGQRKNLDLKLKRIGVNITDEHESMPSELLKYLYDLYAHYDTPLKEVDLIVKNDNDKKLRVLRPIWAKFLDYEAIEWNVEQFCNRKNTSLYKYNTLAQSNLAELLLKVIYSKQQLGLMIKDNFKVKLRSISTMSGHSREQVFKKHHLARILAELAFFPLSPLVAAHAKYFLLLKKGYHLKNGRKVEFDIRNKTLKFTDSYFNQQRSVLDNRDLLLSISEMIWYGLSPNLKSKYISLSWVKKKNHYYHKKTIGFINEASRKGTLQDFREHLYYYFINGSYLRNISSIRHLFFKNNLFKSFLYKSEAEKKQREIKEHKALKDSIQVELNYEKKKGRYVPYVLKVKSNQISLKDSFKFITLKVSHLKEKIVLRLSDQILVGRFSLKQLGVIDVKKYLSGKYTVEEVTMETKSGRKLTLKNKAFDLSFVNSEQQKKIDDSAYKISIIDGGPEVEILSPSKFESINITWKNRASQKISHYITKKMITSPKFKLSFNPLYKSQQLTLASVFINGHRKKLPVKLVEFELVSRSESALRLISSSVLEKKKIKQKYFKFVFKNEKKLEISFEVHLHNNVSKQIISFQQIDKILERDNVVVESIVKNKELIIWVKIPNDVLGSKKVKFWAKPRFNFIKPGDGEFFDVTRGAMLEIE